MESHATYIIRRRLLAACCGGDSGWPQTSERYRNPASWPWRHRPWPAQPSRDRQNPDLAFRRPPIRARFLICASLSRTLICGRHPWLTRQVTARELGISKDIAAWICA